MVRYEGHSLQSYRNIVYTFLRATLIEKSLSYALKNKTTMEQKIEFICEWRTEKYIVTELCKQFNISRTAAYKLIKKFESLGYDGLRELSRAPNKHPNATDQKVVAERHLKTQRKVPPMGS